MKKRNKKFTNLKILLKISKILDFHLKNLISIYVIMENQEIEQSLKDFPKQVTNNSYIELLEKYFLSDKTNDLENKHKEWCKDITT